MLDSVKEFSECKRGCSPPVFVTSQAEMIEMRNGYKILVEKPEGKRTLGRPGCRWEDNIKIDLKEIGCEDVNWIIWLRQGTMAGSCEHGTKPSDSIKGGDF
jgi:hypothetical protein